MVTSSLPSYVNEAYLKELMDSIFERYSQLSENDKKRCGFSGSYYDVSKDRIIVEIVDLDSSKERFFEQKILNWDGIAFKSVGSLAVPMT